MKQKSILRRLLATVGVEDFPNRSEPTVELKIRRLSNRLTKILTEARKLRTT